MSFVPFFPMRIEMPSQIPSGKKLIPNLSNSKSDIKTIKWTNQVRTSQDFVSKNIIISK